jgi:hypothetical protein
VEVEVMFDPTSTPEMSHPMMYTTDYYYTHINMLFSESPFKEGLIELKSLDIPNIEVWQILFY